MGRAYQNRKDSMAKTSDANAKVYSKYSREIYVCAKSGGVEPEGNLALRGLLDRAKKDQVPAHVITKALDKAKGGGGEDFATARYEGFGPGGCMVIVDCLTDNPNRTFGDVRVCFTKTKSKIGTQGTCMHSFDHCAIFVFSGDDDDAILEALMEADVDASLSEILGEVEFDVDEIQFVPQNSHAISGDDVEMFEKFCDMLNELDDVQNIYHNADIV